ncbi:MAG: hypothetical protein AAF412_02015 [Pseudomonadota bacterium]
MKEIATKILAAKTNVLGTIAVAVLASLITTVVTSHLSSSDSALHRTATLHMPTTAMAAASVLDCDDGVYSPVQKKCVSQDVFDTEMQRLFTALGIDTSLYRSQREPSE